MKKYISWIFLAQFFGVAMADTNMEDEIFSINIGTFVTDQGLNFRLDSESSGDGTPLDFENDLGLDNSEDVLRVDGHYWFNRKHRVDFSYFAMSRGASRTIDRTIEFGDEVFELNTTVKTRFDTNIAKLGYSYFIYNREKFDLGVLLGLYVMDISASIKTTRTGRSEAANTTAPLPVIGFRGRYALTPRISLRASLEYFSINPDDDLDGSLADALVAVEYQFFKHVGIGVGYNNFNFDVNIADSPLRLDTDWNYSGYLIYLNYHF